MNSTFTLAYIPAIINSSKNRKRMERDFNIYVDRFTGIVHNLPPSKIARFSDSGFYNCNTDFKKITSSKLSQSAPY